MTVDVSTEIVIRRGKEEVAAFAADPNNVPTWYANIKSVEWKSSPPLRLGSQVAFVAQFLGRRLAYTYEVIDWTPNERFVMRTSEGPFPMETTYTWTTAAEGTRMSLRNRERQRASPNSSRRSWPSLCDAPTKKILTR